MMSSACRDDGSRCFRLIAWACAALVLDTPARHPTTSWLRSQSVDGGVEPPSEEIDAALRTDFVRAAHRTRLTGAAEQVSGG